MRLNSQSSQFIFNLPSDFVSREVNNGYRDMLEKNWIQYESVVDYINSTIDSVTFYGISFNLPKQIMMRGKERYHKPAQNPQDIITSRELQITFDSVDSDLNYWLMYEIINKHYIDVNNQFVQPFTLTCVDINRDAIYIIKFYEIIIKSLSDNTFSYSNQKINRKQFTIGFHFNFYDIEFIYDSRKVLETENVPIVIQKI